MKKQSYKVDIITVANAAGVSAATVSRAINHPDLVNPATRKRVEEAIRKTGYVRNRAAQTMHGRRSATLGLVVPTVNYSIFAELVQSFNDTVSDLGFTLLLATHGYDLKTEYLVLRKLLEHRVDGVALIGLDHSEDTYRLLASQDVPVVAVWNYSATSRISCIGSDNREAGRIAAEHILSLGHRRIGFIFPPTTENDRARGRLEAAATVVRNAGVEIPDAWSVQSRYSITQAKAVSKDLLNQRHPLTALICGNDIIAQGAVAAAMIGSSSVDVLESGVGAINLPLMAGMVGSKTTRSCHPEFHRQMARLVSEVCGYGISISLPFFQRTKGEVVKELTDCGLADLSRRTVSCVHYPLREPKQKQCGVCPACILRRQSLAVAGVQEPEGTYKFDLFDSSQNANSVPKKERKYLKALLSQVVQLTDIESDDSLPSRVRRHLFGTGIVSDEHSVEMVTHVLRTYRDEWRGLIAQAKARGISWTNLVATSDDAKVGSNRAISCRNKSSDARAENCRGSKGQRKDPRGSCVTSRMQPTNVHRHREGRTSGKAG